MPVPGSPISYDAVQSSGSIGSAATLWTTFAPVAAYSRSWATQSAPACTSLAVFHWPSVSQQWI